MTHEEAQELIPAFAASKLQGSTLDGLRAHLSACGECAELASGIAGIVGTLQEGGLALLDAHPSEKELRAYFEGASTLAESGQIEKHLRTCASCSLEVSTKTRGDVVLRDRRPGSRTTASAWQLGAAAAAILGAGILIGVMVKAGVSRPSGTDVVPAGPTSWSGPVDLHVLPPPQRGETIPRFILKKGQPGTILHLPRVIPRGGSPSDRFRLLLRSGDGAVKFDQVYPRPEIERAFDAWGVMPLFMPASSLPSGRYELTVQRDDPSAEKIASIPFEVTREE
ncbi:MAG TPA: zf-HC2 domain-containing protein [Candidatus Polarisedimenticolia bacterium]|nr:zf-HC2 domain-containing protein [Candidatus Polarisedimenticolia bacterium]